MLDLETIIVLVLLAFNFIPQRSHHAFPLTRSRFRDSATVTRAPGDGTILMVFEGELAVKLHATDVEVGTSLNRSLRQDQATMGRVHSPGSTNS